MPLHYLLAGLLIVFVTSCKNEDAATVPAADDEGMVSGQGYNLDVSTILQFVNDRRAAGADCGSEGVKQSTSALSWSDELAKAALDHSNDMQQNNYFDHTGLDGSEFWERNIDAGYTGSPLGENIANRYSSEEDVIRGWMESDGHCSNIMNGDATEIGVAKSDEDDYWTMILGKQ